MEDKRDILRNEQPFDYNLMKNDKIQISFRGRSIKIISGKEAQKFFRTLDRDDSFELQLYMAKITGQFKYGNEKDVKVGKVR